MLRVNLSLCMWRVHLNLISLTADSSVCGLKSEYLGIDSSFSHRHSVVPYADRVIIEAGIPFWKWNACFEARPCKARKNRGKGHFMGQGQEKYPK